MTGSKICSASTASGRRCQAPAIYRSNYCFFHDPKRAEDRLRAQKKGGQKGPARAVPTAEECPPVELKSADDIRLLISDTINKIRIGQMETKIGSTVGYLAQVGLRAIEQKDFEERLRQVEDKLGIGKVL